MTELQLTLRDIVIEDGNPYPIHADLRSCAPEEERPLIIICHGFLGYKRWGFFPTLSERLAEAGFHVCTMSFSLNGVDEETGLITRPEEFARNTVSKELADLERVCTYIRSGSLPLPVGTKGWGLMGYSRGAAIALLVASGRNEVQSIVTWATPSKLDRYSERRKEQWRRDGPLVFDDPRACMPLELPYSYYEDVAANREERDLVSIVNTCTIPHLMIHGDRDAAVTLRETLALATGARRGRYRLEVIEGCGHMFNVAHPVRRTSDELERAVGLTENWFRETLIHT
ncbi:MAG: alpha/beta hydrolase [bacterium]|nr:MAG: alpha/beta hydrolase [bacterium]